MNKQSNDSINSELTNRDDQRQFYAFLNQEITAALLRRISPGLPILSVDIGNRDTEDLDIT